MPGRHDPARRHAARRVPGSRAIRLLRPSVTAPSSIDWPRDILALVVAHALDFRLGRRRMMRDRIAQVLPEWDAAMPGYASVLAMYAFGLEENGQYRRAEKMARRALASIPDIRRHSRHRPCDGDAGARPRGSRIPCGNRIGMGRRHRIFRASRMASRAVPSRCGRSGLRARDLRCADRECARLGHVCARRCFGVAVAAPTPQHRGGWAVAAIGRSLGDADVGRRAAFYVVHAMMAFAAAGRAAAADARVRSTAAHRRKRRHRALPEDALAPPFCEALLAFARSDYAACVEWLTRVRHIAHRCGGSLAQCDLIHLTFTEAALRARGRVLPVHWWRSGQSQKPASWFNRLLQQRLERVLAQS